MRRVTPLFLPLPGHPFDSLIRNLVSDSSRDTTIVDIDVGQRVTEVLSSTPGHSEHEVYWDTERLSAMNMGKAWRVRNDGVGDKWLLVQRIRLNT